MDEGLSHAFQGNLVIFSCIEVSICISLISWEFPSFLIGVFMMCRMGGRKYVL